MRSPSLHRVYRQLVNQCVTHGNRSYSTVFNENLVISEEVRSALHARRPVVALETTIVTHGMPYPYNLRTALDVEGIVRMGGAVPATIGIINGKIHIGLNQEQLEFLADPNIVSVKTSRRDLPYIVSQGLHGGTTVSGTMVAAHMAGISVFVTGGIGGVHRGAESSMDISADLTELSRTPVTVISAGVKSILDIGRTLEYLETEGVCVATFGSTREFPAFFTRRSGYFAPYHTQTARQAAELIYSKESLGLQTGSLIAVPIPEEFDTLGQEIESVIQSVIKETADKGIQGKEITPYILQRVNEMTEGKSLQANIHLIKNNVEVGTKISVELSQLRNSVSTSGTSKGANRRSKHISSSRRKSVTVIGGSIVDFTARMWETDLQMNGASYPGSVQQSFGGVGRNIADGLSRLDGNILFISAIGNDSHRAAFETHCKHMNLDGVAVLDGHSTATYCAVLKEDGELLFGIGDMDIHKQITPQYIQTSMNIHNFGLIANIGDPDKTARMYLLVLINAGHRRFLTSIYVISTFEERLKMSSLVCFDGNITTEAMDYICNLCGQNDSSVFFEPTDIYKATKPFQTANGHYITYSSPNFNELKMIASYFSKEDISVKGSADDMDLDDVLHECIKYLRTVSTYIPVTMVTLGRHGVILCRHGNTDQRLPLNGDIIQREGCLLMEYFPACKGDNPVTEIVSVSGAGDCMVAAFVTSLLKGLDPSECVRAGLLAAQISLRASQAVPPTLTPSAVSQSSILQHMNVHSRTL